jgi:hypothetical protein
MLLYLHFSLSITKPENTPETSQTIFNDFRNDLYVVAVVALQMLDIRTTFFIPSSDQGRINKRVVK